MPPEIGVIGIAAAGCDFPEGQAAVCQQPLCPVEADPFQKPQHRFPRLLFKKVADVGLAQVELPGQRFEAQVFPHMLPEVKLDIGGADGCFPGFPAFRFRREPEPAVQGGEGRTDQPPAVGEVRFRPALPGIRRQGSALFRRQNPGKRPKPDRLAVPFYGVLQRKDRRGV